MPPTRKGKPKKAKKKDNSLFDFLNDITHTKTNILNKYNVGKYSKFMITKFLSVKPEYLPICDILNQYQALWDEYQFHNFCIEVVPKKKLFLNYSTIKGTLLMSKNSDEVKVIADYFQVSNEQAFEYYRICGKQLVSDINELYGKRS